MSTVYNNHSYFWRHADQFDSLTRELTRLNTGEALDIWCAGCAHGEEPYSLALLLDGLGLRAKILATDISDEALRQALKADYKENKIQSLPRRYQRRLRRTGDRYTVPDHIREMVKYRCDDLRNSQVVGPFDMVFCRNVLIYFAADVQSRILEHLSRTLRPSGLLVLGYAESSLLKLQGLERVSDHAIFIKKELVVKLAAPPVPGVSLLSEALSSYAQGRLDEANELLDATLQEDPLSPIGLYFKGMLDLESGRPARARKHLLSIFESGPEQHAETDGFLREHGLDLERFHLTVKRVLERLEKRC